MDYAEASPLLGVSPTTLQEKAVKRGYLSRIAVRRPNT